MRFSQDDGWAIIRFRRARRSRPLNVSNFAQSLPWYGRSFAGAGGSSSFSLMQGTNMYMSGQSLLITLLIGLTAGWVAGQIVQGATLLHGGFARRVLTSRQLRSCYSNEYRTPELVHPVEGLDGNCNFSRTTGIVA